MNYNSPAEIKEFLEKKGFSMQKKFGQNFLINEAARISLIDSLDIEKGSAVWEVGPGLGCMTAEILRRGATIKCFEIDRGFASCLKDFFSKEAEEGRFSLVEGDVLRTWKGEAYPLKGSRGAVGETLEPPARFFGNLPYNVAAAIIADMIGSNFRFEKMVVTVQKEVAMRMCAKAGSADYSSFSVLCQWAYDVKSVLDLAGGNFWPRPNVDSRAVLLTKKADFPKCRDPKMFMKLLRSLFSSRRKTIKNNIKPLLNGKNADEIFERAGLNGSERAEDIPLDGFLALSDAVLETL